MIHYGSHGRQDFDHNPGRRAGDGRRWWGRLPTGANWAARQYELRVHHAHSSGYPPRSAAGREGMSNVVVLQENAVPPAEDAPAHQGREELACRRIDEGGRLSDHYPLTQEGPAGDLKSK